MSPRPAYEPDENEPDEDESPNPKTMHGQPTPAPSSGQNVSDDAHVSQVSSPSSSPGDPSPSMAPSTIGPLTVALVVILVIITCCIIHCSRIRKRLNNEQRTQTINGWTSFMTRFRQPQQHPQHSTAGNEKDVAVNVNSTDSGLPHRFTKPPPMPPCDEIHSAEPPHRPPPLDAAQLTPPSDEEQPPIVFSPGWVYAMNNNSPTTPEPAILPPNHRPERLCPHQVTVDNDATAAIQKPHEKSL